MTELEAELIETGGSYRWEGGIWPTRGQIDFDNGDAIVIDPFPESISASVLCPIYGEFIMRLTEDIVKVSIPSKSDDDITTWFDEEGGEYLIHRGYIMPQ